MEDMVDGREVEQLFTENETDKLKISSGKVHEKGHSESNRKGAFNNYIVHGKTSLH